MWQRLIKLQFLTVWKLTWAGCWALLVPCARSLGLPEWHQGAHHRHPMYIRPLKDSNGLFVEVWIFTNQESNHDHDGVSPGRRDMYMGPGTHNPGQRCESLAAWGMVSPISPTPETGWPPVRAHGSSQHKDAGVAGFHNSNKCYFTLGYLTGKINYD